MEEGVQGQVLRATALVALLAAACTEGSGEKVPRQDAKATAARLLEQLCGGRTAALDGLILGWRETDADAAPTGRRFLVALAHPDKLRLEIRAASGSAIVFKINGKDIWIGPAGGPFAPAEAKRVATLENDLLLLGSLVGWDLRDGDPALEGGVLRTKAKWFARRKTAPTVTRELDANGAVRTIAVADRKRTLGAKFEGTGGAIRHVAATAKLAGMHFTRFDPDAAFKDSYFEPESVASGKTVQFGDEKQNFEEPRLEFVPDRYALDLDDPGDWAGRMAVLDDIGRKLWKLGQESGGLPIYTSDGRMLVLFGPREGQKRRAPEGLAHKRIPGRHALVLYVEASWKEAVKTLEEKLAAKAEKLGLKGVPPLRLRPYAVPGADAPKGPDAVVKIRGELDVR